MSKIRALQRAMSQYPQLELPTFHYFADGMYCRVVPRPAGTLIVGKVHKREHLYLIMSGDVTVSGDNYRERFTGWKVLTCQPGTKRAVYAHADSVCCTVHKVESTDIEAIEKELVEEDPEALFDAYNRPKGLLT